MTDQIKTTIEAHSTGRTVDLGKTGSGRDLVAYRIDTTTTTIHTSPGVKPRVTEEKKTVEGITFFSTYQECFRTSQPIPVPEGSREYGNRPYRSWFEAVKPAYLAILRTKGWHVDEGEAILAKGLCVPNPYSALEAGGDVVIIEICGASQEVFAQDGLPLPVHQVFGYTSGGIDNSRYDLRKVVPILLARPDVDLVPHAGYKPYGRKHLKEGSVEWYIAPIPGYNQEPGRTEQIQFYWSPGVEDYRKVYDVYEARGCHDFRRAALDLDIFGIGLPRPDGDYDED